MSFEVNISTFEGPLDLMLHLINQNKLDLFDLDVEELAKQYSSYVLNMPKVHLESVSEYMIELASLLEYKSKKLLPRQETVLEEEYEDDQRERLVQRLVEYQKYKEAASLLEKAMEKRGMHFSRPESSLIGTWKKPIESSEGFSMPASKLVQAMNKVLRRQALLNPWNTKVEVKEVSVEDVMEDLSLRFSKMESSILFETLVQPLQTLHEVIVTFLAILELIHRDEIHWNIDEEENLWIIPKQILQAQIHPLA